MSLRDVLVKFGIEVDGQQKLAQTDRSIQNTIHHAEQLGKTLRRVGEFLLIGGLVEGVKSFIESQVKQADALKHNADRLGVTVEELQKYQYAASIFNVSTQETAIAMRFFNRAVGEASLGTRAAQKTFAQLGINIKDAGGNVRPTNELLFEFSDKLKAIPSQAQRTAFAVRTLGRNGSQFLPVLQKGGAALKELFQDVDELGGGFNEEFIEQAHATDVQLKRLKMGWRSVYVAIAAEVLPSVIKFTKHAIEVVKHLIYLAKHTYGFRTALMALASGVVFFALKRLFSLFAPAAASVGGFVMSFLKLGALGVVLGILTALYFAFDDLYTFLKGGDSDIGESLNELLGPGGAKKFRDELVAAFEEVKKALSPLADMIKGLSPSLLEAFSKSIPYIIKWGGIVSVFVIDTVDRAIMMLRQFLAIVSGEGMAEMRRLRGEYEERAKAYQNAARTLDTIGSQVTGPPRDNSVGYGATEGTGTREMIDPRGNMRLPPPPAPVHVTVHQSISGVSDPNAAAAAANRGVAGAVGGAVNRNTHTAVNAGMPASGQ